MAEDATSGLVDNNPEIPQQIDHSFGYAVANMKVTNPFGWRRWGEGMLVDKQTQQRTYFTVERLDLGGGYGARLYKVLIIINSLKMLDKIKGGARILMLVLKQLLVLPL